MRQLCAPQHEIVRRRPPERMRVRGMVGPADPGRGSVFRPHRSIAGPRAVRPAGSLSALRELTCPVLHAHELNCRAAPGTRVGSIPWGMVVSDCSWVSRVLGSGSSLDRFTGRSPRLGASKPRHGPAWSPKPSRPWNGKTGRRAASRPRDWLEPSGRTGGGERRHGSVLVREDDGPPIVCREVSSLASGDEARALDRR